MSCSWAKVMLGATGLSVCPLGLGASYGVSGFEVERAFERGINYLYWGSHRKPDFGRAVRKIAQRDRERVVIAVQSYTRVAALMQPSLERALRHLNTDHVDLLCLGWWNAPPSKRIVDAALALREAGKVRHLMISCHHRPTFQKYIEGSEFEVIQVRYNAAHPGAESEVFPFLPHRPVGVVAFTATRWGDLINPALTPSGESTPRASDCYRFSLTNPNVEVCLAGPRDGAELDEAMAALDRGPMTLEEVEWMRRVGASVRSARITRPANAALEWIDRLVAKFC